MTEAHLCTLEVIAGGDGDHDPGLLKEACEEIRRLRRALMLAAVNDATYYEHHQARKFDGKTPKSPGTIWLTPREIARRTLAIGIDELRAWLQEQE